MEAIINLFFSIGLLALLRLVWQDFKNKRMLDSRYSSFMMGVVLSMFFVVGQYLNLLLYIILFSVILALYESKIKPKLKKIIYLGKGDISILLWVLPGLVISSILTVLVFVIAYLSINVIQTIKYKKKYPGTLSIMIAFVIAWFFHMAIII